MATTWPFSACLPVNHNGLEMIQMFVIHWWMRIYTALSASGSFNALAWKCLSNLDASFAQVQTWQVCGGFTMTILTSMTVVSP